MFSKAKPLLSLTEWCSIIGMSPYLISQIGEPRDLLGIEGTSCERVFFQDPWQSSESLTRSDVVEALLQAETTVARILNYFPALKFVSESVVYPRAANLDLAQLWYGKSGRLKSIATNYKRIYSMGVYEQTLIDDNVAVTTSDPYTSGFDTNWSMTVAVVAGTTADQIKVYYNATDRLDLSLAESEIYPVTVSISGLVATISGHITQIIKPANFLKVAPQTLDATDATNYATTLDVYLETIDLAQSGTLQWNIGTYVGGFCDDPPCQVIESSACFVATDANKGFIAPLPATYDADVANYTRLYPDVIYAPDVVLVNYISGIPKVNGRMQEPYNRIVAYLATALLPQRSCGCAHADLRLSYFRDLPTDDSGNLRVDQSVFTQASQMFGVSGRGAIQAMKLILDEHLLEYESATG